MTEQTRSRNTRSWLATRTTPGSSQQERLEELDGLVVEVVRGLVEDHALGSAGDQGRQGEPGPLAAGELAHRSRTVEVGQPEVVAREVGAPIRIPGVVLRRPGQHLAVLLRDDRVVELVRQVLQAPYGVVQRRQRVREHLTDGRTGGEGEVLGDVADLGRQGDRAGVRVLDADEEPQQSRLADAVLADQPGGLTGVGEQVDAVEHDAVAVRLRDVVRDKGE